jgi:antitoxin component of MazEF toxin-antitoxin module
MVVQVQKIGDEFVLPPQVAQELGLVDGSRVEITRAETATRPANRYASVEEAMKAHREMEPFHAAAYRELAK